MGYREAPWLLSQHQNTSVHCQFWQYSLCCPHLQLSHASSCPPSICASWRDLTSWSSRLLQSQQKTTLGAYAKFSTSAIKSDTSVIWLGVWSLIVNECCWSLICFSAFWNGSTLKCLVALNPANKADCKTLLRDNWESVLSILLPMHMHTMIFRNWKTHTHLCILAKCEKAKPGAAKMWVAPVWVFSSLSPRYINYGKRKKILRIFLEDVFIYWCKIV